MSNLTEGLAQDVYGLLAEMSKKIDHITDKAESVNEKAGGFGPLSSNSGHKAAPAPGMSPQFNTTGEQIRNELKKELKMGKSHSFGKETPELSEKRSQIQGSFLTSDDQSLAQIQVANNQTNPSGDLEIQSDSSYNDGFDSTFNKTESFGNYNDSFASSKLSDSKTFKMNKNSNEPMDEDDMLLQESR